MNIYGKTEIQMPPEKKPVSVADAKEADVKRVIDAIKKRREKKVAVA
jgi:hypothetical protein